LHQLYQHYQQYHSHPHDAAIVTVVTVTDCDITQSATAADAVRGETLLSSVQKAANFVGLCITGSEKAGTPVQEGVVFEKYLAALL